MAVASYYHYHPHHHYRHLDKPEQASHQLLLDQVASYVNLRVQGSICYMESLQLKLLKDILGV